MKSILLFIFFAIPAVTLAQINKQDQKRNEPGTSSNKMKTPEERAAQLTTVLGERLQLSDEQKDKVYEISLVDARLFDEKQKHTGKKSDDKPVFKISNSTAAHFFFFFFFFFCHVYT